MGGGGRGGGSEGVRVSDEFVVYSVVRTAFGVEFINGA